MYSRLYNLHSHSERNVKLERMIVLMNASIPKQKYYRHLKKSSYTVILPQILPKSITAKKKKKILSGIIAGLICPLIGIFIFYLWKAPSAKFTDFLNAMLENKALLTAAISFSLLLNAVVFTWCVNTRRDQMAKGVFVVTLLITIPAIIYKLFFS